MTHPMTAAAISAIEGVARSGNVPPVGGTALYVTVFVLWLARVTDLVRGGLLSASFP